MFTPATPVPLLLDTPTTSVSKQITLVNGPANVNLMEFYTSNVDKAVVVLPDGSTEEAVISFIFWKFLCSMKLA